MPVMARMAVLCGGGQLIFDPDHDDCWSSDEVSDWECEVDDGTLCDGCEEPIGGDK